MNTGRGGKPVILVVDDKADRIRGSMEWELGDRAVIDVVHPGDLESGDLLNSHLVLVDYKIGDWPERDRQQTALKIQTGLALAVVLRETVDRAALERLTIFALHTGHLAKASGRLRPPHSRHIVARLNNLEWVFEKTDSGRFDQMMVLATAAQQLGRDWPRDNGDAIGHARRLLGMETEAGWFGRCWRDVSECQPPIHQLAGGAHRILVVRWLLHQVLPYPCFLWDAHRVAARLRLHVDDLKRLTKSDSELAKDLRQRRYSGILAEFLGDRWWRGAIEDYAWDLAQSSDDVGKLKKTLSKKAGEDLELTGIAHPVVHLGADLQPSPEFSSPSDAVNLRPDHWPAFADAAWMTIETAVSDPALRAMVDPLDEHRLPADDG